MEGHCRTVPGNLYITQFLCNTYSRAPLVQVEKSFLQMKGDVGMSGHEKERKQEDAYTKIQTHS